MAELAQSRAVRGDWLTRPVVPSMQWLLARDIDWELVAYGSLIACAFILRIWDVGARAMHHDESLHATYAWYLFKGSGYQYNPLMHGPLQFYAMAFFYLMFGDSETTARLFAVLCGSAIVFLPYFLRRDMGKMGALIAAVTLTISPTFLYFSRFARDDILLDFFCLLLVIAMWAYFRSRSPWAVYLCAASAALAMSTMEAAYIVFFILGSFIALCVFVEWMRGGPDQPVIGALRSIRLEVWLWSVITFGVITILLYSTFLSNPNGIFDTHHALLSPDRQDILGGLTYWWSQHGVARGGQPWYYYLLLFPLYEQFALIFGAAGIVWALFKRRLFTTFLAYWFVMALAIFSWAGEKMPWLFLHPLLPGVLLAATFAGWLLQRLPTPGRTALAVALCLLLLAEAHSAQALAYSDGANPTEMLIYVQTSNDVPKVAADVIGLAHRIEKTSTDPLIQVDNADLQGWPFEWYFRNLPAGEVTYGSDFSNPTAPILIMLGPEEAQYNRNLRVHYIASEYKWNWWFPEDYKGLTFDNGMCGTAAREVPCAAGQTGTVFLKTGTPCPATATVAGPNCSLIQTPAAINIFSAVARSSTWINLWNWFAYRTPFGQRGNRQLFLYVRRDLVSKSSGSATGGTTGPAATVTYKSLDYHRVRILGATGPVRQRLLAPRGIGLGPSGVLLVADSGTHRMVEFSASGHFIRGFGRAGSGPAQFSFNQSPMDAASGRDGKIYVADFWNHRIEEFSSRGKFIRAWGSYGSAGGSEFFGPRSVSVAANGNVYVADTGNRQIAVFSPRGRFLFRFGSAGSSAGEFEEPSAVLATRSGVYVADMWNSRIQHFDIAGHYLGSWAVPSWQANSYQEPYLAQGSRGDVLATDPSGGRILEFSSSGKPIGAISVDGMNLPIGLAETKSGTIYVSEAATGRVIALAPGGASGRAPRP